MSLTILLSALAALLGCLAYALASNGKVQELGRLAYFAGLISLLLQIGSALVKF